MSGCDPGGPTVQPRVWFLERSLSGSRLIIPIISSCKRVSRNEGLVPGPHVSVLLLFIHMNPKGSKMWRITKARKLANVLDFFPAGWKSRVFPQDKCDTPSCQLICACCYIIEELLVSAHVALAVMGAGRRTRSREQSDSTGPTSQPAIPPPTHSDRPSDP